jgi:hypothetical protein
VPSDPRVNIDDWRSRYDAVMAAHGVPEANRRYIAATLTWSKAQTVLESMIEAAEIARRERIAAQIAYNNVMREARAAYEQGEEDLMQAILQSTDQTG